MIQPFLVWSDWAIFVLRVVVALTLIRHGLPKLKDLRGTGGWFESVGFRPGAFWALVAGLTETLGGLAMLLGFLTQLAALLVALEFVVILVKFRGSKMFAKDAELEWLILAAALALMTLGSGALSLNSYFGLIVY
ncbi:MAG: DoxX family protein [Candidatus Brennerbacteria bacterium]|nr:DoxX family protein [Candidatus Brennerbacteria bacterium]